MEFRAPEPDKQKSSLAWMEAKTVGQSLALGSYPIDWIYDYEHGFIKALLFGAKGF